MRFYHSKLVIRISALLIAFVVFSVSVLPTQATKDVEESENATSNMESNVSSLNKELDSLVKQLKKTGARLEQTKEELAIAKGEEDAQYESMMLRIKYMYESGNSSLLELLLSSSCLPEFINRAEYISQVTEYDRDMLEELAATSKTISEKEEQLLEDQKYLASLRKDLDKKIAAASDELDNYKTKLEKAKEDAKRLEEEAKKEVKPIPPKKETSNNDSDKESGSASNESSISATASDVELLAALLECEAGTSNYEALLAVGSVVVNRMKHRNYPDTVRGVIYQSGQFPPAHDGKVDRVLKRGVKALCLKAAQDALSGKNNVGDCLSFRASSSGRPGIVIGDNVFF